MFSIDEEIIEAMEKIHEIETIKEVESKLIDEDKPNSDMTSNDKTELLKEGRYCTLLL